MSASLFAKRVAKVRAALRNPHYRRALRHRVLAASEHEAVLRALPRLATVIDVGANVGQFAIVARSTHPDAEIISFEPMPDAAGTLRRLFAGDRRFRCVEQALCDEVGELPFHLTRATDSSSLLRVAPRQVAEFPDTSAAGLLSVSARRLDDAVELDDLAAGPLLLKIDTQGTELAVLQGARSFLARATHLIVEVSFVELYEGQGTAGELLRHLLPLGWDLVGVYDVKTSRLTGEPIQADFLFSQQSPPSGPT